MKSICLVIAFSSLFLVACGSSESSKEAPNAATAEQHHAEQNDWTYPTTNLPEDLRLVTQDMGALKVQVGKFVYESPKATRPWSGWWVPLKDSSLYNTPNAPLRKYDALSVFALGGNGARTSERFKSRSEATDILSWEGLCDAWSLASVYEKEPKDFLMVDNVCLTPGDQKTLLTVAYKDNAPHLKNNYYGQLNKKGPNTIFNDIYPDQFHRFIQVELGARKSPFLMDFEASEPIWTVPVYKAEITIMQNAENPNVLDVELYLTSPEFQLNAEQKKLNDLGQLGTLFTKRRYTYSLHGEWQGSDFVVSKGLWTQTSIMNHPDYVISLPPNAGAFPQGNDENKVDYFTLKSIFAKGKVVESCVSK